jgi:hypothetical protein
LNDKKIIGNLIAVVVVIAALSAMQRCLVKAPVAPVRLTRASYDAFYIAGYEVALYDRAKRVGLEGSQSKAYTGQFSKVWDEYSARIPEFKKRPCRDRAVAGFLQGCADAFAAKGGILTGAAIEGLTMLRGRPSAMIAGGVYYEGDSICGGTITDIGIGEGRLKVVFRREEMGYSVGETIRNPHILSAAEKERRKLGIGSITPAMVDALKRIKPYSAPQTVKAARLSRSGALREGENENFINALRSFRDAEGYNRKEDWETAIRDAQTSLERDRLTPEEREALSRNIRECRDRISSLAKREKYDYHYGLAGEALERSEGFEEDAEAIKEKSKRKALYKKALEYCEKALGSYKEARKYAPTREYKASCEKVIASTEEKIEHLKEAQEISIY